jgi:branched-chain amino acid transport system ATP-binding protein
MTAVLEGGDLVARYGGATALDAVDVAVGEWEIVGVFGPAGSGKTAVLDALSGSAPLEEGAVFLRGTDVTAVPAFLRARLGIARTWEATMAVRSRTVMHNLLTAQHAHAGYNALAGMLGGPASFGEEAELTRNAQEILDFLGMLPLAEIVVQQLSEQTWRMVDLAMALATDPDVVLLDEPTLGMSAEERIRFGRILAFLRDSLNLTVLVAAREPAGLLDVADYAYVMEAGRVVAQGDGGSVRDGDALLGVYGGGHGAA